MNLTTSRKASKGMTLMEVVVALGIIGFVLPIIISAMASTGNDRRKTEAETRSSWMMRNIQREILAKWATPPEPPLPPIQTQITSDFPFPLLAEAESKVVMIFDRDGNFLSLGSEDDLNSKCRIPDATYVAKVNASAHSGSVARVSITISQPAKAAPVQRSNITYDYLTTRLGTP